jgi:DNA-binding transcriptional LysR family regulator
MFRESGLECPNRLVETASPMVVTKMLAETDFVAVLPGDVADYYSGCGLVSRLPIALSCALEPFGVITRKGWLLSPAAQLMCETLEDEAVQAVRTPQTVGSI